VGVFHRDIKENSIKFKDKCKTMDIFHGLLMGFKKSSKLINGGKLVDI
jgi:hypothetical protein